MGEALTCESEEAASRSVNRRNASQFMLRDEILWPMPPPQWRLGAADVHLWAAHLDLPLKTLARLACILSEQELQRATRFRFETHHNRFIAGRGILRSLLGMYLNCGPQEVQFAYGPNGKPELAGQFAESRLRFNLAHSDNLALVAVTRLGPIGVDVEQIRHMSDADELVERFFSARENALFQTLPPGQKEIPFLNLWTRKEAWLKATGEGIAESLNRVEVTFLPDEPARLLALPEDSWSTHEWVVRELLPAPGFVGAVALPNVQLLIFNFQFSISEFL